MKKLDMYQQKLIYQTVTINSNKIVLLDVLGIKNLSLDELNNNICCIDSEFNIIWTIDPEKTKFEIDSFTSLKKTEDGKIYARKFSGFEYVVDPKTGHATIFSWNK